MKDPHGYPYVNDPPHSYYFPNEGPPKDDRVLCDCNHKCYEDETLELEDGRVLCVNCAESLARNPDPTVDKHT